MASDGKQLYGFHEEARQAAVLHLLSLWAAGPGDREDRVRGTGDVQ